MVLPAVPPLPHGRAHLGRGEVETQLSPQGPIPGSETFSALLPAPCRAIRVAGVALLTATFIRDWRLPKVGSFPCRRWPLELTAPLAACLGPSFPSPVLGKPPQPSFRGAAFPS